MSVKPISELITTFINRYDSINTAQAYTKDLIDYVKWLRKKQSINELAIEYEIAINYEEYLKTKDYSKATRARKLIVVRKFYSFLLGLGLVKNNPFQAIRVPSTDSESKTNNLSHETVKAIWHNVKNELRDKLIFYFLIYHGMRVSEIAELKSENIFFDETPRVKIFGKRDKFRLHPLKLEILEDLKKFMNKYSDEYVFVGQSGEGHIHRMTLHRLVKKMGEAVGTKDIHPHQFRHHFVTNLVNKGYAINDIKYLAGHTDINTTDRYYRREESLNNSPILKMEMDS